MHRKKLPLYILPLALFIFSFSAGLAKSAKKATETKAPEYKTFKHKLNGKDIEFQYRIIDQVITEDYFKPKEAKKNPSAKTAFGAMTKMISLLADDKIDKAAKLTNNPEGFKLALNNFKKKVGKKKFIEFQKSFFGLKNNLKYEIVHGKYHSLLIHLTTARALNQYTYVEDENGNYLNNIDNTSEEQLLMTDIFYEVLYKRIELK